ncbi:MAG: hypothetical protein ACAI25_14450 [Planctomycetota bacterium]
MRQASIILVCAAVWALSGCGALVGASIDAGFRELLDDGKHPVYRHQSYGAHFVDALVEAPPHVDVDITVQRRRRSR